MRKSRLFAAAWMTAVSITSGMPAQDCCSPPPVQSCQPAYRMVCKTVYEEQPYTAYRLTYETVMEERQISEQRPEWTVENRERKYTVAKPFTETVNQERRYTVWKQVTETSEQVNQYEKVSYVTETQMRQEKYVVQKPVYETTCQQKQTVVRKPVSETVMQQQQVTAYSPVTTYKTEVVDQGSYVNQVGYQPARTCNHLSWLHRGYSTDPTTGVAAYHRGGLYWVPNQTAVGTYTVARVYVPNYVAQQVPQTTLMPQTYTQETPVQVTRYVDEVVTENVQVPTVRYENVEEVREIPVQVQKPVTEIVEQKVPVSRTRWEAQEVVQQVPVQVQRVEYEERVEPYQVRTCKFVTETRSVQVPRTVAKWVAYEAVRRIPRTVVEKVPLMSSNYYDESSPTVAQRPIINDLPILPPPTYPGPTTVQRVEIPPMPPMPMMSDGWNSTNKTPIPGTNSIKKPTPAAAKEPKDQEPTPDNAKVVDPADADETGKPMIPKAPKEPTGLNPPANSGKNKSGAVDQEA